MACRQTGFALLASGSVQEAQDLACIAHAATLRVARPVPAFLRRLPHVARGRARSSALDDDDLRASDRRRCVARAPRARADARPPGRCAARRRTRTCSSRPARPPTRFYDACPASCRPRWTASRRSPAAATASSTITAHPDAERVIVLMGSGARDGRSETVEWLVAPRRDGRRTEGPAVPPVLASPTSSPRCRRPSRAHRRARPHEGARRDRRARCTSTSSPPCARRRRGRPSLHREPRVVGGRYGLSSKEFTPAMVKAVFDELTQPSAEATTSPSASSTT